VEGPLLRRSNLLDDGHRGCLEKTGHSYGVMESLGIAVLSRGHSYGVTGITGNRGAIERTSMNQPMMSSTNVDTLLLARHKSATRDLTINVAPNIRPPLLKFGFPRSIVASWRDQSSIRALRPHED
jgi:hypothetical protein